MKSTTFKTRCSTSPLQEKQTEAGPAQRSSPSTYLFTRLFVYGGRRESFLHLLRRTHKNANIDQQEQSEVCPKMDAEEIEGDKHQTGYGGSRSTPSIYTFSVCKAHQTYLKMEQIYVARVSCSLIERW